MLNTSPLCPQPYKNHSHPSPITASDMSLQSEEPHSLPSAAAPSPAFIQSIIELKDLSSAINSFQQCYDDLLNHLDSIRDAIMSKLPPQTLETTPPLPSSSLSEQKIELSEEKVLKAQQISQNSPKFELEGLCQTMCSRGIKRYLMTHLSSLAQLREEVPKALKLAPNPAKLVLECLGKFFLQGTKAFTRGSPMIASREASIFILECFLLMMGLNDSDTTGNNSKMLEIEKSVRQEADDAALAWRKRLVQEGGLAKCNQVDARGLLLVVACFGIPTSFKREDLRDLVVRANAKEIVNVLKNSHVLMDKIPEIVEWMLKTKMEVDAVDIACTFGLEEKFNPQAILTSFLQEYEESSEKPKKSSQGTAVPPNEVKKKQLAALKSVNKCLEKHKIDPVKLLSGWQISEKISALQKDVANFDRKAGEKSSQKRKASEFEPSKKSKAQEAKRSRYTGPNQQQKASGHVDSRRNSSNSRVPTHASNYSTSSSVIYGGPGAGMLPETMLPPGVGARLSTAHGGILSSGSYPVVNQPNVWLRDEALIEKYASQPPSVGLTSLYRASTSAEGFVGFPNASSVGVGGRGTSASDLYHFADVVAESESYPRSVAARTNAVPGRHPSYLYQV